MPLPPEMVVLLAAFAPLFSDRVWAHAQILAIGAILATGKRTVTSALHIMGLSHDEHFTNSHRVLNRAAWCPRAASRILLGLIVRTLVPADWPIVLVADDTVERRHGRKIKAKGCYRDAVRSSRKVVVKCFGLKWVAMMVLVQLPWNKHVKALPFLTVLGWPESAPRRRAHKTSIDCVKQMVLQVRRWFPQRRVVLVLDGGFAAVKLARACRRHGVTMICRLRLDAGLYDPPGEQPTSKRGPKPKKGPRRSSSRSGPGVKTPPGRIARSSGMVANGSRCGCSRGQGCGTRPVKIRWRSATCWRTTPRARWKMRAISARRKRCSPRRSCAMWSGVGASR